MEKYYLKVGGIILRVHSSVSIPVPCRPTAPMPLLGAPSPCRPPSLENEKVEGLRQWGSDKAHQCQKTRRIERSGCKPPWRATLHLAIGPLAHGRCKEQLGGRHIGVSLSHYIKSLYSSSPSEGVCMFLLFVVEEIVRLQ